MKIILAVLCTFLCFWNACTDLVSVSEQAFPNRAYQFLYNGKKGTRYVYSTFEKTVDTNGVEANTPVIKGGELVITQGITVDVDGNRFVLAEFQPTTGFSTSWLHIANDSSMEVRNNYIVRMQLKTPFTSATSFKTSNNTHNEDTSTTTTIDVNTTRKVPAGIFKVIGTECKIKEINSSEEKYLLQKYWYSEGTGWIEWQTTLLTMYPNGKKYQHTTYFILSDIYKP